MANGKDQVDQNALAAEWGLSLDNDGKGPRLKITDLSTGMFVCLDPLELESLAWVRHEHLAYVVRPAYRETLARVLAGEAEDAALIAQAEDLLRQASSG